VRRAFTDAKLIQSGFQLENMSVSRPFNKTGTDADDQTLLDEMGAAGNINPLRNSIAPSHSFTIATQAGPPMSSVRNYSRLGRARRDAITWARAPSPLNAETAICPPKDADPGIVRNPPSSNALILVVPHSHALL
jgi:hypothetical protein